jgi:nitrous oxidase accessory protein
MRHGGSLLIALLLLATSGATGTSHNSADIPELADLVARTPPGSILRLPPGTFRGPVTIDRPITILGSGPGSTLIQGNHQGNVLTVTAGGVTIRNLTVRGSGSDLLYDDAGILILSDNNVLEDLALEDNLHGIYLKGSSGNTLRRIKVIGRKELKEEDRGNGFHMWDAHHNLFEDNEVAWSRDSIYFSFASNDVVRRNRSHHSRYGIHFMYADNELVEENQLEDNIVGLVVMFSRDIHAKNNIIRRNNAGYRSYGFLMSEAYRLYAEGNAIVANNTGVLMDLSIGNTFSRNLIAGNFLGINLLASSQDNLFVGNTFTNNGADVRIGQQGLGNRWNDSIGNYWSSYRGWDLNGDGIGDVPHRASDLFPYLAEERPQLMLLLGSPAVALLNEAERRFPVLQVPKVEDTRPLMRPVATVPSSEATVGGVSWPLPAAIAAMGAIAVLKLHRLRLRARGHHA